MRDRRTLRTESGDAPKNRQWLKSLRQDPVKTPQPGPVPSEIGEPFDELVDTTVVALHRMPHRRRAVIFTMGEKMGLSGI